MTRDEDQLNLLSTFHYVVAGLAALFACFPVFHLIIGLVMVFAPDKFSGKDGPPPAFFGWFFVIFAAAIITCGMVFAAFVFAAGRFLARRKHYMFCLVMAGIECCFMPFGTVLGVFTIVLLMRDPVKQLFPASHPPPPTASVA